MAGNQKSSKRKAPNDDEVEIPAKKHKNTETDIPYSESSKNAAKRKASEDINKEQPKHPCPTCKGTDHQAAVVNSKNFVHPSLFRKKVPNTNNALSKLD